METERPLVALNFLGLERSSCQAQDEHDRADASSTQNPAPPSFRSFESKPLPSVAMSLRSRENSSMALKHIFDRLYVKEPVQERKGVDFGTDASAEKEGCIPESTSLSKPLNESGDCDQLRRDNFRSSDMSLDARSLWNYNGERRCYGYGKLQIPADMTASSAFSAFTQQRSSLEKNSLLGLQTTEKKATSTIHPSSFTSAAENEGAEDMENSKKRYTALNLPFQDAPIQDPSAFLPERKLFGSSMSASVVAHEDGVPSLWQERQPESTSRTHRAIAWERQPKAQLTIFYSGMVNVFDDVPADKARAIMFIAGNGSGSSSNPSLSMANLEPCLKSASFLPASEPLKDAAPAVSFGGLASTAALMASKSFPSPAPIVYASPRAPSLPVASAELKDGSPTVPEKLKQLQQQLVASAPAKRSQAELPFARKASLARFLVKRKDMVQVKASEMVKDESREIPSSPKKQCTRSPSFGRPSSFPLHKV